MFLDKFLEKSLSLALIASTTLKLLNVLAKGRMKSLPVRIGLIYDGCGCGNTGKTPRLVFS